MSYDQKLIYILKNLISHKFYISINLFGEILNIRLGYKSASVVKRQKIFFGIL
jgi:hypothetical protein